MSIRSTIGSVTGKVQDSFSVLSDASSKIQGIVGSTTTSLSNIWSGGFVGMSEEGMTEIRNALTSYCEDIQGIIDGFDEKGDIASAVKGTELQTATYDFIGACKDALKAYVSTMKANIEDADEAYKNFLEGSQTISKDVTSDAADIRSNAQSISLD